MNSASLMGQFWVLISTMLTTVSALVLLLTGVRRCWRSLRVQADPLWRAAGGAWGASLVCAAIWVSIRGTGVGTSRLEEVVWWSVLGCAVLLWCAAQWAGRVPVGQWLPGRYVDRPHRARWAVGVWVLSAAWLVMLWIPRRMQQVPAPELSDLLDVGAVAVVGAGVIAAWVQSGMHRSWMHTGSRWSWRWWRPLPERAPGRAPGYAGRFWRVLWTLLVVLLGGALVVVFASGADAPLAAASLAVATVLLVVHLVLSLRFVGAEQRATHQ